jgi:DNA modification methylase
VPLLNADARHLPIADNTVQCCVTSPPYWGLRDYGTAGQIGLEQTPDAYVAELVAVFREVWRVLRDDGVLWLNLGDCYANDGKWGGETGGKQSYLDDNNRKRVGREKRVTGLKPKDLVGMPWRVAFALQADGWWLRQDVVWHKPNALPESVLDRCTKSHEYVFLLAKNERYFYDVLATAEPCEGDHLRHATNPQASAVPGASPHMGLRKSGNKARKYGEDRDRPGSHLGNGIPWEGSTRRARSVWTIPTQPYSGAHFATMPEALAERCILAGSRTGDLVLDPFGGSGTTARAAISLGRRAVVTELNPSYLALAAERTRVTRGLPLEASA